MVDAIREIMAGKQLKSIEVLGGRYFRNNQPTLENLTEISQQFPLKISSINVKGKFCWIELDRNWYIAITFGMAGGIYYEPTEEVLQEYSKTNGKQLTRQEYMKHFHIKFTAADDQCFYFGDSRHFGTVTISQNRSALQKKLNKLGPDMLTGTPISDSEFIKIFRQPKFNNKNICKVLMGQEAISGVGNYIKAEVLYECQINPWALIADLDDSVLIKLHQAIKNIVHKAYAGHGTTLYTYTGTRREKGTFQNMLKVYGKEVDPVGNKVMTIGENISPDKRTTHYVPVVQVIGNSRDPMFKPTETVPKTKMVIKFKPGVPHP